MAGTLRPRLTSWWQGARDGRSQGAEAPGKEINVLFYRDYQYFTGGHLKVWHYCEHVRHTPGFRPLIAFSPSSRWDATNPWLSQRDQVLPVWDPRQADLLFLAGMDWLMLGEAERWSPPRPVINLIQHVRHADCDEALYAFLPHPALRICVSAEVAQALHETGRVNGPLMTIPNGIDLDDLPSSPPWEAREVDVLLVGIKQPALAAELSHRLLQAGWRLDPLVTPVPRQDFCGGWPGQGWPCCCRTPGRAFICPPWRAWPWVPWSSVRIASVTDLSVTPATTACNPPTAPRR